MRCLFSILFLLAAGGLSSAAGPKAELLWPQGAPDAKGDNGFVPLFNGKDLTGWEGDKTVFRVQDGAIVGGSLKKPLPRNEFLTAAREYKNFELRAKCKLIGKKANGAIQIRSQRVAHSSEMIGYQPDMDVDRWGTIWDESRRNKVLAGPPSGQRDKYVKANGWNQYVIRCQGRRIQLWLNGVQTADYTEPDRSIPQTGLIGLQIHGGGPSEAWYKDIQIRELPEK